MESSWRRDCADTGVGWVGIRLFSRIRSNPDFAICALERRSAPNYAIYVNLGGIQGWVLDSLQTKPAAHPDFPYGWDVDPDLH